MERAADDRTAATPGRPSWGGFADAIGHCFLAFALLPPLAVVPGWLSGEARNGLNAQDPIVLAFLPARGALALLDAFRTGLAGRLLAGILAGVLLSLLAPRYGRTTPRRLVLGALCGAIGASGAAMLLAAIGRASGALAPELVAAVACGALAAPGAVRLAHAAPERAAAPAPQRDDPSPSASHQ